MTTHTTDTDRGQLLRFIASQQSDRSTATAYLGMVDQGLEWDLDHLDQPWLETIRVRRDGSGQITGAACVEWDVDVDLSWIYGPWCTDDTWASDADGLLEAMVAQAPVGRHEYYGAVENVRFASLAEELGWRPTRISHELAIPRERVLEPSDSVRAAEPSDVAAIAALHEHTFPGTYATAAQIVDAAGSYTTLVLREGEQLVGYVAGKEDAGDAYVDFIAVAEDCRRTGAGRRLLGAFAAVVPGERIRLTCSEKDVAALEFYKRLGFEELSATRAYRRTVDT